MTSHPMTMVEKVARAMVGAVLCAAVAVVPASAKEHRSREVTRDFQRLHPCPSTGQQAGACRGWVKDHIWPLCAGGEDSVQNMQWQKTAAAKDKDRWERKICKRGKG